MGAARRRSAEHAQRPGPDQELERGDAEEGLVGADPGDRRLRHVRDHPVVIAGTVYTQDINSNVYSINLESGKVNWFKKYNSPTVGPNGVNVVGGVVYGATGNSAFALQASTGEQLWIKKLTRNQNEGIDMAPGVNDGTRLRLDRARQRQGLLRRQRPGDPVGAERQVRRRGVEVGRGSARISGRRRTRTSTPAAASGIRPRSTRMAISTSASRTRRPGPARRACRSARAALARTSTRTRSSSSTTRRAS